MVGGPAGGPGAAGPPSPAQRARHRQGLQRRVRRGRGELLGARDAWRLAKAEGQAAAQACVNALLQSGLVAGRGTAAALPLGRLAEAAAAEAGGAAGLRARAERKLLGAAARHLAAVQAALDGLAAAAARLEHALAVVAGDGAGTAEPGSSRPGVGVTPLSPPQAAALDGAQPGELGFPHDECTAFPD